MSATTPSETSGDTPTDDNHDSSDTEVNDRDSEDNDEDDEDEEDDDDDDGEEDEPKLKYARLTGHLLPVYRNGDATSAFLVAGDKMVRTPSIQYTMIPILTINV